MLIWSPVPSHSSEVDQGVFHQSAGLCLWLRKGGWCPRTLTGFRKTWMSMTIWKCPALYASSITLLSSIICGNCTPVVRYPEQDPDCEYDDDRFVLLQLWDASKNHDAGKLLKWNRTTAPASWAGVKSRQEVAAPTLRPSRRYTDTLSVEALSFVWARCPSDNSRYCENSPTLKTLNLSGNNIEGPIPVMYTAARP